MTEALSVTALQAFVEVWTVPVIVLSGGIIVGYVFEKVIHARLVGWATHAQWGGSEVINRTMRGMIFLWFVMIGVIIAANNAPISSANRGIIEHVISVLWVLSATVVAARAISGFLVLHIAHLPGLGSTSILANIASLVVYVIGLLVAFQTIGISIAPILTALGVGGLAVALALQDTLSNLFAGIHIIVSRHVRIGDFVRLDTGDEGYVADIGWRNTTVRNVLHNLVVVPNAKLAGAIVTNYSLPEKHLVIKIPVAVGYDCDLRHVESVTMEVARSVLPKPAITEKLQPSVRFHAFGDSSINADVSLPVPEFEDQAAIRHEFIIRLHERFRQEHIEIPYPIREIRHSGECPRPSDPNS